MTNRIGSQRPNFCYKQKYCETDGDIAIKTAESYVSKPFEGQKNILNDGLARDSDGTLVHGECGLSVARQNGKNELLAYREAVGLLIFEDRIVHTAHSVKAATRAFRRLKNIFKSNKYPELQELTNNGKLIRQGFGNESITCEGTDEKGEFHQSFIEFSSRANGTNVGANDISLLVIDEAQYYTAAQESDIMPILSASKSDRQIIYTGTPIDFKTIGDRFQAKREQAKEGKQKGLCWHEWSVSEIGDKTDKERGYATNPSLGLLLDEKGIEEHELGMSDEVFAVQRLGYGAETAVVGDVPINATNWRKCATEKPPSEGIKCFAVKFTNNGQMGALSVCLKPKDSDKRHIETIEFRPTDTLTGLLDFFAPITKNCAQIIIDGKNKSADLAQRLIDIGVPKPCVWLASTGDLVAASSMLESAINEQEITHFDQEGLNDSACNCLRRPIGSLGGGGWCDAVDTPSAIIESAALAYYASRKTKRNPGRKGRVR